MHHISHQIGDKAWRVTNPHWPESYPLHRVIDIDLQIFAYRNSLLHHSSMSDIIPGYMHIHGNLDNDKITRFDTLAYARRIRFKGWTRRISFIHQIIEATEEKSKVRFVTIKNKQKEGYFLVLYIGYKILLECLQGTFKMLKRILTIILEQGLERQKNSNLRVKPIRN